MKLNILSSTGEIKGQADLSDNLFETHASQTVVHEVVQSYLANQRKGTHETLTRSFVGGSGKKPWKQKHTGRARAGTSTSPLWRGGGIIFGPHARSYRIDVPHKKIEAALCFVLRSKLKSNDIVVMEKPLLAKGKTKEVAQWRKSVGLTEKTLMVLQEKDDLLKRCSRNLKDFEIIEWGTIHPYHVLNAKKVALVPEVIECLKTNGQS